MHSSFPRLAAEYTEMDIRLLSYRRADAGSGVLSVRRVFNDHKQVEASNGVNVTVCQLPIMIELNLHTAVAVHASSVFM